MRNHVAVTCENCLKYFDRTVATTTPPPPCNYYTFFRLFLFSLFSHRLFSLPQMVEKLVGHEPGTYSVLARNERGLLHTVATRHENENKTIEM